MGKLFDMKKASGIVIAVGASVLLVALVTFGATTISTSINTGGTLTVSGASTLTGFFSTASSSVQAQFNVNGPLSASSTLIVAGATLLNGAVTLGDAVTDDITITGNATSSNSFRVGGTASFAGLASTSQLVVGGQGTNGTISGIILGTCNLTAAAVTASTTKNFYCSDATGVRAGDKVFVSATSSLIVGAVNAQYLASLTGAASSTVSGRIDVDIMNIVGVPSVTIAGTLNFWAIR